MTDQGWRTFADESDWHADDRRGDLAWLGCALCFLSAFSQRRCDFHDHPLCNLTTDGEE